MEARNLDDIKLIFKHTHRDYKSQGADGSLNVAYPAPYYGCGSINAMPLDAFNRALAYAKRKESALIVEAKLKPIMSDHGLLEHFCGSMQWRDSLDSVIQYASFALRSETAINNLRADLEAAHINFNC